MTEQERSQAVAAVGMHEHQAREARAAVDRVQAKVDKFEEHLKGARGDLRRARQTADDEEKALAEARKLADQVLAEGPVTIRGEKVNAYAGVAEASAEGKGGNS